MIRPESTSKCESCQCELSMNKRFKGKNVLFTLKKSEHMIVNSGFPCSIQKIGIKKSFIKCRIMKRAQFMVIIYCETRTRKKQK